MGPQAAVSRLLQRACCAQHQVIGRQFPAQVFAAEPAILAQLKVQLVAPVHQQEDGLQKVVAVGAPSSDVQKKVELGGRGNIVERLHGQVTEAPK